MAETSKYLLNIMMVAYNKVVVNAVSNRRDNSIFIKAVRKVMDKKRSLKTHKNIKSSQSKVIHSKL